MKTTIVSLIGLSLMFTASAYGVPLPGQLDDFEDGTTQGWSSGAPNPNPPANIPDGGPGGTGDAYLQVTSGGGFGPGSQPTTFNSVQWTGDYTAAGVTDVQLDAKNLGAGTVDLRLLLEGAGGRFYTAAESLAPGGGWKTLVFPVGVTLIGGSNLSATLANVTRLRVFHNPNPGFPGPAAVATYGIDNIAAMVGPAFPGDANLDGAVNDLDLTALAVNWQQSPAVWTQGDFNGDGCVDDLDLTALAVNWQQGPNLPEPASALILLLGFAGAAYRRGRRR